MEYLDSGMLQVVHGKRSVVSVGLSTRMHFSQNSFIIYALD
jgi:hypothetical protein